MRKIALLFLIAALVMGGGYYWLSERPAPAPNPAPDPRTAISGAEKVAPKTAPFTRPDPQPVPHDLNRVIGHNPADLNMPLTQLRLHHRQA